MRNEIIRHPRNLRFKWLIHDHYLEISFCIFSIAIFLGFIFYLLSIDWKIVLPLFAGLISFIFFIQKQQLEEAKFINELFINFNSKYDQMNDELNLIIEKCKRNEQIDDRERNELYDYFNLCGEEYLFYKKGYVYQEVWESWVAGMKIFYENEKIHEIWEKELSSNSYYNLDISKEIELLPSNSNKKLTKQ